MRWMTAGESHGPSLVGVIEGIPAGIAITTSEVQKVLARRRLGHGRGARMAFEQDQVRVIGGIRHGVTMGSPIAIEIGNTEDRKSVVRDRWEGGVGAGANRGWG